MAVRMGIVCRSPVHYKHGDSAVLADRVRLRAALQKEVILWRRNRYQTKPISKQLRQ